MNLCPKALPPRWILAALCVLVAAFPVRAEQIQFSKPVVPLAAPAKQSEKLSRDHSKGFGFSDPSLDQPMVSQPQIIRIRPRESQDDEEEADPREPRELSDPSEKHLRQENARKTSARERRARNQPRTAERQGSKRLDGSPTEDSNSLSPVTDFSLNERDEREPSRLSSDPLSSHRSSTNRSNGRSRGSLTSRADSEQSNDKFRPLAFFDVMSARAKEKEKPTREALEQRAAFDQLINPKSALAVRTPGSFEPVTTLEPPKSAVPLKTPAIGGGKTEPKRAEPVQQFGFQQARPPSPLLGDINKNSTRPAPAPGQSIDPLRPPPLNRQPSIREFPTRKF